MRREKCVALFAASKDETSSNINPERTRFDIYATTASACVESMNRLALNPHTWGGQKGYVVIERIEPVEIGSWALTNSPCIREIPRRVALGPPLETPAP